MILSDITKNKPIFSQYNIFYKYKYFFFQSVFWSPLNHREKGRSNQQKCTIRCSSPCFLVLLCTHYKPLQCFSTVFQISKEITVLHSIFTNCCISCDYDSTTSGTGTRNVRRVDFPSLAYFRFPGNPSKFILILIKEYVHVAIVSTEVKENKS